MANKKLVVVESPTKAKTIQKMLGSGYKVVATIGHLRDLPKSKLGIDIENDFEPQYINVRGKASVINSLKKDYKNSQKIFLATDPDREGEAISWHLCYLLDINPEEENRVKFQEITKDSVKEAIKKPEAIDLKLVDAQQARRVLDRIVGYSISPLLWKKVKSGLSAGRVQSVALRLICEREKEIREFEPEEYWSIHANLSKEKLEFDSELYYSKNDKSNKINIKNKNEADKILNDLSDNFVVNSIRQQKKSRKPYAPFTTSTLQQEAYKKLYFQTSKTMRIAQQLYEGISLGSEGSVGLITYMRTDSTRISHVCVSDCLDIINNLYGKQYATKGYDYSKRKKGSQDAHEGIRPSSVKRRPNEIKKYLTDDQYKLYKLIWERTVASQMKDARYLSTSIDFDNNGYTFRSNGNVVIFDGFTRVYSLNTKDSELPELKEKDSIISKEIESKQHFTKPKPRYTEASLVKTLEEDGIGRPSTYASIISSILSRNYVELKEKKFYTTEIGEKVCEFVVKYFDSIINEKFTAEMENELDNIAENDVEWKK